MNFEDVTVTALLDGERIKAQLATCEECGGDKWYMFMIVDQDHSHFQCVRCGTSYCPDGVCGAVQ